MPETDQPIPSQTPASKAKMSQQLESPSAILVSVEDLTTMFSLSANTIRRLIASGELPSRRYGRLVRVRMSDALEWANRLPNGREVV